MTINFKEKTIKYLNRDFQTLKRDLMEFTKAHQSGSFQDFNESSPGMALLEQAAFVGDVLSFYQDMQFEELKETARQLDNATAFAKKLGYRPSGKTAANAILSVCVEVPATTVDGQRVPDERYCPILRTGAQASAPGGVIFETLSDVHFSASAATEDTYRDRMVTGSQFDPVSGLPTYFAVRKDVVVLAGETVQDTFFVDSFERFKTLELSREDVIEVVSVVDSDGNSWYQVDYLPQETIFESTQNESTDSADVPYTLKIRSVPRRFVTDRDPTTNKTSLVFGSGDGTNFDDELVPNVASFALPVTGKRNFTTFSIDPQNFLKTRTLGLSPFNTTLTVTYRVGGGEKTNVPAGTIKSFSSSVLDFSTTNLDTSKRGAVESSLECFNFEKSEGGNPEETIEEINANRGAFFAAQNRVVTDQDFIARVLSLPAKFGKVYKCFVKKDPVNELAVDLHVLTKDKNNHLAQATPTLVKNIRKYLSSFRMMTDGVNILQTDIINVKVDFGVVVSSKFNRSEVLGKCLSEISDMLSVDRMQIGQPIVVSDLVSRLQQVNGVISVYKMEVKNVFGNQLDDYTDNLGNSVRFDVKASTQSGIVYCPDNAIFQVKYPGRDINGEAK